MKNILDRRTEGGKTVYPPPVEQGYKNVDIKISAQEEFLEWPSYNTNSFYFAHYPIRIKIIYVIPWFIYKINQGVGLVFLKIWLHTLLCSTWDKNF